MTAVPEHTEQSPYDTHRKKKLLSEKIKEKDTITHLFKLDQLEACGMGPIAT